MEFIHLYADDTNGEDIDIAIEEADDAADLGDFIDDASSSSFQENTFYRAVDNNLILKLKITKEKDLINLPKFALF